jgi:hypothetical protein
VIEGEPVVTARGDAARRRATLVEHVDLMTRGPETSGAGQPGDPGADDGNAE